MNAHDLAQVLKQQAGPPPHQITLTDAAIGTQGLDALATQDLRLKSGVSLTLLVDPSKIPADPPDDFTLDATVPPGDSGFLNLGGCLAKVEFVAGTPVQVVLTVFTQAGGTTWAFSDSFPEVTGLPYDALTLKDPALVLSTGGTGKPPEGFAFAGQLELTGLFGAAAGLLGVSADYPLDGAISGQGQEFSLDLDAPFGVKKTVGSTIQFELENTKAGVALTPVKTKEGIERLVEIYLGATVAVENSDGHALSLDARAAMPLANPSSPIVVVTILPTPGFKATLTSLGGVIGGDTFESQWNAFFAGPASSIGALLDDFGLLGYSATVSIKDVSILSMSLEVGTLQPWSMWTGGPELSIDVLWNLTFLGGTTASFVVMKADFTYPPKPATDGIEFELTIDSDLNVTGVEKGMLPELKLSDLNQRVFGGNVVIPEDLVDVQVGDITFSASLGSAQKHFAIGAVANASVSLFGAQVLGVRNMALGVSFAVGPNVPTTYTGTIKGEVFLGPVTFATEATISDAKGVDTVFTLHLVDETVGSMLNHFVHIVDPTYDVDFGDPWNKLLDISLDAFVLEVNVTKGSVALSYEPESPIDLVFLTIDKVSLTYTSASTSNGDGAKASSTKVDVAGTFLGVHFPSGDNALTWDPINETPPAVPGKGGSLFDLEYAGLGQHIGLAGDPETMDEVMKKLRATASPVQPGALPPIGHDLVFKGDSSWLIGAQFTVMDTVSIKAVFNDPDLYGVVLELSGEKAKLFAGLRFEILYRKVTPTIGVYHIELKLPDAMRHLEFGEVAVTLPVVDLDIYTNGNFRVDFGFPKGLDFSNSFSVQVFPFVGYGGFYFALLDGATSSRVPQITNGTFSPVIEFGVALSIGVGKDIDEGVLKGGISVTVVGILEGVLAWFHPTDSSPAETYYWFKGTLAVTGHLYATIDFAIIQASVDVTAYISATVVIESHQPIYLEASASVSVRVSVKIVFFTIHLSFSATVDASFTIGSATPTPWIVKPGAQSSAGPQRLMRGQRTVHAPAALVQPGHRKALRRMLVAAQPAPPLTSWPDVLVFGAVQPVTIKALTAFTKAEAWAVAGAARAQGTTMVTTVGSHDLAPGDEVTLAGLTDESFDGTFTVAATGPSPASFSFPQGVADATAAAGGSATAAAASGTGEAVLLLTAESTVPSDAVTLEEHCTVAGDAPAEVAFSLLMEGMLRWGILAETHRAIASAARTSGAATFEIGAPHGFPVGAQVTIAGCADATFDGAFAIQAVPTPTSFTVAQAAPDATTTGGTADVALVTADQLEDLRQQLSSEATVEAAFAYENLSKFLAANYAFTVEQADTTKPGGGALFPMFPDAKLTDSIGTSVDFSSQPVMVDDAYVAKIRAYFQLLQVQFQQRQTGDLPAEDALADVEDGTESMSTVLFTQYFNMLMSAGVKAAIDLLASYPYLTPGVTGIGPIAAALPDPQLVDDPLKVVQPNQDAKVLNAGARIPLPDVVHQVRAGESFAGIAAALAVQGALGATGQPYASGDLLAANAGAAAFATGVALPLAGLPYVTVAGDSLDLVAARLLVRLQAPAILAQLSGLPAAVAALVTANAGQDPNVVLTAGTSVKLPGGAGTYTSVAGDTLTLVAAYGLAPEQGLVAVTGYAAALQAANPTLPTDPTAPLSPGTTVALAALSRPMAPGDTITSLAQTLMTTEAAVGAALVALTTPVLSPQAVLHAPLTYAVAAGDTLSAIAAKFDVALADLATQAADVDDLFAAGQTLTIADLPAVDPTTLVGQLLQSAAWNKAAGMVSRFLLSGIRLPDPRDAKFQALTPEDLLNPGSLAGIRTQPAFKLTGQQYPVGTALPSDYSATLAGAEFGSVTLTPTPGDLQLFTDIASTPLDAGIETLTRLALFTMAPPRIALQAHVAWQAAVPPAGCFPAGAAAGNPSVWMFPDSLIAELERPAAANTGPLPYEVVTAKHTQPDAPVVATEAGCCSWATRVDFTVSLPVADGTAASLSNAYVVEGADDVGAELLYQVQAHIAAGDSATLHLLYPPNPAGGNASGMASDALDPNATYLLKTNLSTETHAAPASAAAQVATSDPPPVYAAALGDPADFLALLWEASITRSGGFYLQYVDAEGGAGLPSSVFDGASTAQLSVLVLLGSQSGRWPVQPASAQGAQRTAAGVTTIATGCVHGLAKGDQVTVSGVADASFDGTFAVTDTPTAWTFTYAQTGLGAATSGGGAVNAGATAIPAAGLQPFNNCAVIGESVDPSVSSVFVQPATYPVQPSPDPNNPVNTLEYVAAAYAARWGAQLAPADVAAVNADVPQLLAVGASIAVPGAGDVPIGYGDTFGSIATHAGVSPSQLGAANATAPILAPGAVAQYANAVLQPATIVPPGVAGFEMTRTNPDPGLTFNQLDPAQKVGALFNLVGWSLDSAGAFTPSGAGLPTTPSDKLVLGPGGLVPLDPDATGDASWYYQQVLAVAPFGSPQNGSASPALPPAAADPYNGVGAASEATIALNLQDVYGNVQPLPDPTVAVPVGYYDDLAGPGSWPSLAMAYVVEGPPPKLALDMTMQQTRYIPTAAVPVASARAAIAADLQTYTGVYYQLVQPDVTFSVQTTLALAGDGVTPIAYPLSKAPFLAFAYGAWVYLQALSTTTAVQVTAGAGDTTVPALVQQYGVTPGQLFAANQTQLYSALFGDTAIAVPQMYATIASDSLATILAKNSGYGLTAATLAEKNQDVPLNPGADLQAQTRTVHATERPTKPPTPASLGDVAAAAHASAAAIAGANATTAGLLVTGAVLTLGTTSYTTAGSADTLANAAAKLRGTVQQVAAANVDVPLFVADAPLSVDRVLVAAPDPTASPPFPGDTLRSLAAIDGVGTVDSLATTNEALPDLFATATSLLIGTSQTPKAPEPGDSLAAFAARNGVTLDALAGANAGGAGATATFATGATITIPAALENSSTAQFCTYSAPAGTDVQKIADLFGSTPAAIVALNPDLPGLLAATQTVIDSTSGKSVTTAQDDTFASLVAKFAAAGAAVTLDQLAADVAGQPSLVAQGGLWICPPMRGDAHGANTDGSLTGLGKAYDADATALALANAATLGVLATSVGVTVGGVAYTTQQDDTLNSLVNRFASLGVTTSLADVVAAALDVPGLVAPGAAVLPVPPPSPADSVTIAPHFGSAVFQLAVNLVEARDPTLADPDFAGTESVVSSTLAIPPDPDPGGDASTLALTAFANALETAIPGLKVATGDPAAEEDPASATAVWAVNLCEVSAEASAGAPPPEPAIGYLFEPASTAYYALPPLSSSLMSGDVDVKPYVSTKEPPFGDPESQTFRGVDLDGWLDTFLDAVDLFLSPAFAVPGYALKPTETTAVIAAKDVLARHISDRVKPVLEGSSGVDADARDALYESMLTQLSTAFTVDTLVQVPVKVHSQATEASAAPRLSGKLMQLAPQDLPQRDPATTPLPQAYSFSTGKVPLTDDASAATFLFSVKAPSDHRAVSLDLEYVVTALELPDPGERHGAYEGSYWLTFVNPIATTGSQMAGLDIPVPLRAYPGPVTLATQTATQSKATPAKPLDLLGWDLAFVYQHDDAEQDTPLVEVAFNTTPQDMAHGTESALVANVFAALAQFIAVYPAVKADLELLTAAPVGTANPKASAAIEAFNTLVAAVKAAFVPPPQPLGEAYKPTPQIYYYQLQKEQADGFLTQLVISSIDPATGKAVTPVLWPASITATYDGTPYSLSPGDVTATTATFSYPAGKIPAQDAFEQQFVFDWPSAPECAGAAPPKVDVPAKLTAPQTFQFLCVNVLAQQNARAGVSIWRNLELIAGKTTNDAFVYRTPVTSFTSSAIPSVAAGAADAIPIGSSPTGVAEALGTFLKELLTTQNTWADGDTLTMRFGGGYSYALAGDGPDSLAPVVPIFLVAAVDFDPQTDWDWTNAQSFVSQVQAVVTDWQTQRTPAPRESASIVFDMTILGGPQQSQPLIHAASLSYELVAAAVPIQTP
jgi:LysM repeat protein